MISLSVVVVVVVVGMVVVFCCFVVVVVVVIPHSFVLRKVNLDTSKPANQQI